MDTKIINGNNRFTKSLRTHWYFVLSLFVATTIMSCNDDPLKDMVGGDSPGIVSRTAMSSVDISAVDLSLSFDVVTKRSTSFKDGISDDSPGWKKHAARSETETYSYSFAIENGEVSCILDNYSFDCIDEKRKEENAQMTRFEYEDDSYIIYDKNGNIIDQGSNVALPFDQLDLFCLQGLDTALLSQMAIHYEVIEDKIAGVVDRSNGLGFAGSFVYDLSIGRMLYVALQNESDQITSIMSNEFDQQGKLLSSVKLFYDYLEDGDIMITQERNAYSNFILNS